MNTQSRRHGLTAAHRITGWFAALLLLAISSPASASFISSYNLDEPVLLGTGMFTVEISGSFGTQSVLDFMGATPDGSGWDDLFVEISAETGSSGVVVGVVASLTEFTFFFPYALQPSDTPLDVWVNVVAAEDALTEKVPEPTTGLLIAGPLAVLGIWHRRRMRQ